MKTIRVFFAISLPESLQNLLKKLTESISHELATKTFRWTPIENLHITLQFIREIQCDHLNQLIEKVRIELKDISAFQLELTTLHLFPSAKHPRVVALHTDPHTILADLSYKIGLGISAIHYALTREQFRGHLTLGRIARRGQNLNHINTINIPPLPKAEIKEICLFESKTGAKSQIYIPLAHFKLPAFPPH